MLRKCRVKPKLRGSYAQHANVITLEIKMNYEAKRDMPLIKYDTLSGAKPMGSTF